MYPHSLLNADAQGRARPRHLLSLEEIGQADLDWIVRRGVMHATAAPGPTLHGLVVGSLFAATSTRTRTAFTAGALRLGAHIVAYGPDDLQLNTGETYTDTGIVLGSMLDALVVRTPNDDEGMRALASGGGMAVINAMSASQHPTQALSDLSCLYRRLRRVEGLRVLYLGEGNNTATALSVALALAGAHLELRTPAEYGMPANTCTAAAEVAWQKGGSVVQRHDVDALPDEVDVVYTTRWETTGTQKTDPNWRAQFSPFRVSGPLFDRYPNAVFMHDLPAHRGQEVDKVVIDGPRSIVFDQAAMKMSSAMAVLEWCLLEQYARESLRTV